MRQILRMVTLSSSMPRQDRFGLTPEGTPVDRFFMANRPGLRMAVLTLGGIIAALEAPDRDGRLASVVVGLPTLDGYLNRSPHFGALTGRFGNRIANGRFANGSKPEPRSR